jgi:hypothetical protein
MATNRIADMTEDDLNALIERVVDRHLQYLFKPKDMRSREEVLDSIDRHRITPSLGAKSPLEMLRENRDA